MVWCQGVACGSGGEEGEKMSLIIDWSGRLIMSVTAMLHGRAAATGTHT